MSAYSLVLALQLTVVAIQSASPSSDSLNLPSMLPREQSPSDFRTRPISPLHLGLPVHAASGYAQECCTRHLSVDQRPPIQPCVHQYNALLRHNIANYRKVWQIFETLTHRNSSCQPMVLSFNHVFASIAYDSKHTEHVNIWSIITRMRLEYALTPNADTVVSILQVFRNRNDSMSARIVWDCIIQEPENKIIADRTMYELLIDIFANNAEHWLVKKYYALMWKAGIKPNSAIIQNVLRSYVQTGDMPNASRIWMDILRTLWKPPQTAPDEKSAKGASPNSSVHAMRRIRRRSARKTE